MALKVTKKIESKFKKTLLLFLSQDKNKKPHVPKGLDQDLARFVQDVSDFQAKENEIQFYRSVHIGGYKNICLVGIGKDKYEEEAFRQLLAKAYRELEKQKLDFVEVEFQAAFSALKAESIGATACESFCLSGYKYSELKKDEKKDKEILFATASGNEKQFKELQAGAKRGHKLAKWANFARRLGDTPANLLTPTQFAQEAQKAAKEITKLKCSIWSTERIKKEKMELMLGVAKGSSQPPKVIYLEYKGNPNNKNSVAMIGKGLTFDSGGTSLKPAQGMEEMKYDMCGGANILASALCIADLGLKVNFFAMIGCTENMSGPSATKPGDVLIGRNGKSVEVINTDAEGRLVLADLLAYASEKKPSWIIDAATLTGAMMIALGDVHTGFYTSNDKFAEKINKAAEKSGELVWRMPVTKEHSDDIKGKYSDLQNIGKNRKAGSATAAAFLKEFVPENIAYAHFDVAGTAFSAGGRLAYHRSFGATGAMVRTFVELV